CPDAYDVDWAGVEAVNVVRGPVAFLYGGGSGGGVIDIHTRAADYGPLHGGLWVEGGSNSFYKTRGEISGRAAGIAYLISGSRTAGDGYRIQQAFWGDNVYGRFRIAPPRRLHGNVGSHRQPARLIHVLHAPYRVQGPGALVGGTPGHDRARRVGSVRIGFGDRPDQEPLQLGSGPGRPMGRRPAAPQHRGRGRNTRVAGQPVDYARPCGRLLDRPAATGAKVAGPGT